MKSSIIFRCIGARYDILSLILLMIAESQLFNQSVNCSTESRWECLKFFQVLTETWKAELKTALFNHDLMYSVPIVHKPPDTHTHTHAYTLSALIQL